MAIDSTGEGKLNNANPTMQDVQLGTAVKANQDNITAILAGQNIVLPTSDPGVAGYLWADTLVVKVSAGA